MTGEETVGDVIGEFCREEADGSTSTGIVPVVTVSTHTVDGRQCGDAIARNGNPRRQMSEFFMQHGRPRKGEGGMT